MQIILKKATLLKAAAKIVLRVNKTKIVSSYIQEADKIPFFINSLPAEKVRNFKYLESTLISNSQTKDDITTLIMAVRNAFF